MSKCMRRDEARTQVAGRMVSLLIIKRDKNHTEGGNTWCKNGRHNTWCKTTYQHRTADTWRINRETNEEGNEGDTIMRWQDGRGQTIYRRKHKAQHKHNRSHVPKTIQCPLMAILGTPAEDHDNMGLIFLKELLKMFLNNCPYELLILCLRILNLIYFLFLKVQY